MILFIKCLQSARLSMQNSMFPQNRIKVRMNIEKMWGQITFDQKSWNNYHLLTEKHLDHHKGTFVMWQPKTVVFGVQAFWIYKGSF